MNGPAQITVAARARVRAAAEEIRHSLQTIAKGCPGDAEREQPRRIAVAQYRTGTSLREATKIASDSGAEAVWGQTVDFVDAIFFERGMLAARSVCRVISRGGRAIGTGFLISPRLMITNNHVLGSASTARDLLAEFDYERALTGNERPVTRFGLDPEIFVTSPTDNLDFTVVALGPRVAGTKDLAAFGFLPLSSARNKHQLGDIVNIIQHPDGRLKEAVVRENQLVSRPKSGTVLHYVADTEPGASGSPVFNVMWNVVALHHWGGPHRELFDEKGIRVPRTVNEGIRASAIVLELDTRKSAMNAPTRAAVEEALTLGMENAAPYDPAAPAARTAAGRRMRGGIDGAGAGVTMEVQDDGTATWLIPLAVSVRLGGDPGPGSPSLRLAGARTDPPVGASSTGADTAAIFGAGEAKLELDEQYGNRSGYDSGFLKSVIIPMPKLSDDQEGVAARNQEPHAGDDPFELKYEHFSAVVNGKRKLAFFTATNIDGAKAKDVDRQTGVISDASGLSDDEDCDGESAEAAEDWFIDRRIKETQQTPSDFFSGQTAFDSDGNPIINKQTADHRNRMFQQGHLTRRQDPLWGPDDTVVRAHADTFHVTNRAPQVGYFNMGTHKRNAEAKKAHASGDLHWRALEEFVLANARADRQRVTVFTGPIFDDDKDIPWSRGRAAMKGFKAPREYWKVVLRIENGKLHATALVVDQSPLIDFVPELLELPPAEAKQFSFAKVAKYHVSIADLSARTGLDFGSQVKAADTFKPGGGESVARRVENVADVSLTRRRSTGKRRTKVAAGTRKKPKG